MEHSFLSFGDLSTSGAKDRCEKRGASIWCSMVVTLRINNKGRPKVKNNGVGSRVQYCSVGEGVTKTNVICNYEVCSWFPSSISPNESIVEEGMLEKRTQKLKFAAIVNRHTSFVRKNVTIDGFATKFVKSLSTGSPRGDHGLIKWPHCTQCLHGRNGAEPAGPMWSRTPPSQPIALVCLHRQQGNYKKAPAGHLIESLHKLLNKRWTETAQHTTR